MAAVGRGAGIVNRAGDIHGDIVRFRLYVTSDSPENDYVSPRRIYPVRHGLTMDRPGKNPFTAKKSYDF